MSNHYKRRMSLAGIDWAVILGYFCLALGFGIYFSRRASRRAILVSSWAYWLSWYVSES